MSAPLAQQIAVAAAQLVVDDGLEYAAARHKAALALGGRRVRPSELPRYETIEDEVHAYIALFHAHTQGRELRALRELAVRWMKRLQAHRPHLAGAAWRGTATRHSALLIDLYCDDPKRAEVELLNHGITFDAGGDAGAGERPLSILSLVDHAPGLPDPVTLHLRVNDRDDVRGALRPDARGRSWRGDLAAVQRLLAGAQDAQDGPA